MSDELEEWDTFDSLLTRLIEEHPADVDLRLAQASAWYQRSDYERALHEYREAVDRQPDNVQSWNGLAGTLEALERFTEAIEAYLSYRSSARSSLPTSKSR